MNHAPLHHAMSSPESTSSHTTRRDFLRRLSGAAAVGAVIPHVARAQGTREGRRIKLGVIGTGGRGAWIAGLFAQHGGYEMWAVADYFPEVAAACGDAVGVAPARRFSGLGGYRRLIESGVEAVALEAPPYFYPEHVRAAVDAGLHVYMAKPVAVDAPGALEVLKHGERATRAGRAFLVDYQMPTDPLNIEVAARIRAGALGPMVQVSSIGVGGALNDPPFTGTLESRLRHLIWVSDAAMGCDHIGNYGIHAIDAVIWALGSRPVAASGASRRARPSPHGDSCDVISVVYEYADGLVHNHYGQAMNNNAEGDLSATLHGRDAVATIHYWGRASIRGGAQHFAGGPVKNLYQAGAERNIARFHHEVTTGQIVNDTCQRAVDGVLTCVLGQVAAARGTRLTMEQLIAENRRLEVDLSGLKI